MTTEYKMQIENISNEDYYCIYELSPVINEWCFICLGATEERALEKFEAHRIARASPTIPPTIIKEWTE